MVYKNFKAKRNRNKKTELGREITMKEIERLKILLEKLEHLELSREILKERLEKLGIEIKKIENREYLINKENLGKQYIW